MKKYILLGLVTAGVILFWPHQKADASEITRNNVINSVNQFRTEQHLGKLRLNRRLNLAAQKRAEDMKKQDYFSHISPQGKRSWDFIKAQRYGYSTAGENLALGFSTTQDVMSGWINSPTHRANLQNQQFTEAGVGFIKTKNGTLVVLLFARPLK